jgi:N-methylhydantoinase A
MHACALAEELGIRRILIPAFAGVLSALGMALADLRRDYRRAVLQPLRQLEGEGGGSLLAQWAEPLIRQATSRPARAGALLESGSALPRPVL